MNAANNQNREQDYVAPDHILLATDLNDGDYLLPHTIAQARASAAAVTIVHVTPPAESIPLDARAVSFADAATMKLEATCKLEEMAIKVRNCGVTCNFIVSQGSPQHVLPELVQRVNADRLILGTHGRQHLKRLLLGSVAQEIFNSVDLPVCTIGPRAHRAPARGIPERILHPVSLRQGFEHSARLALEMAQFYQAEITLLHVLNKAQHLGYEPERIAESTRLELRRLIPDEAPLWTYVNAQVEMGGVVDHVLNVAAEMQADLIVLGVDADGSFWPVQGDGTAYGIITQATCPVITVRHAATIEQSQTERGYATGAFAGMF